MPAFAAAEREFHVRHAGARAQGQAVDFKP